MNSILSDMLSPYQNRGEINTERAFREVAQQILLAGLARTDFFDHASFYGGTCLRIFYGLDRFSEDLDFGITSNDPSFSLSEYLPAIDAAFSELGLQMKASIREKIASTTVESAYVDGPVRDLLIELFPKDERVAKIVFNQKIKIKFEVAKAFVPGATYEYKPLFLPYYSKVRCHDKESLFAGKISAVLARNWKSRVKGRDYYDFAFYVSRGTGINMDYLKHQLVHDDYLEENRDLNLEVLKELLTDKMSALDVEQAKSDVRPFLYDESVLNCWSTGYFLDLVSALK